MTRAESYTMSVRVARAIDGEFMSGRGKGVCVVVTDATIRTYSTYTRWVFSYGRHACIEATWTPQVMHAVLIPIRTHVIDLEEGPGIASCGQEAPSALNYLD